MRLKSSKNHSSGNKERRLSVQECRKIMGSTCNLTDSELETQRDNLYALTDIVFEAFQSKQVKTFLPPKSLINPFDKTALNVIGSTSFLQILEKLSSDEREALVERVAIMEHEGNLSRSESERLTLEEFSDTKLREATNSEIQEN